MSLYSIAPFIREHYPQYYSIESYPAGECAPIRKTSQEWGILSNFAKTTLEVGGVIFNSAERLFQTMKFQDEETVRAVFSAANPKFTAKKFEKTRRRPDWGEIIVDAMKFCLQTKYEQSLIFRSKLEESKGKFIVEDQSSFPKKTADTWGVKLAGDNYSGPNLLGRLLMELRDGGRLVYNMPTDALDFLRFLIL